MGVSGGTGLGDSRRRRVRKPISAAVKQGARPVSDEAGEQAYCVVKNAKYKRNE